MSDSPAPAPRPEAAPAAQTSASTYPYRFGEVGVMMGVINRDQVRDSLQIQRELDGKSKHELIGTLMIQKGWLNQRQVAAILVAQKRYRKQQADSAPSGQGAEDTDQAGGKVEKLGHFELLKRVGEGSMGAVFRARNTQNDQIVALKVLPKNLASDQEFLERFKREVKTLEQLSHPNIVAFHGSGQLGGYWYLAMEFVYGESLSLRLQREKHLPETEGLRIACDIARALAHAHGKALIHRDIKPENVLIAQDGAVKVTDFGLAKSQEDSSKLTAVGLSIGTPYYLSPEQAIGSESVDHRADLYSLGVTLFHLLTGRVPFDDQSSTRVMVMHVQQPPPDPRSINGAISRSTAQFILRLMSKDPVMRPQTANEVVEILQKLMRGEQLEPAIAAARKADGTPWTRFKAWLRWFFGMQT
ncbi:MAG: serine/threonine protein kinase [Planctomycetes bacterium]|nr:serine/threonine protein kinase [Planctomycetota bacterium]